jgi:hypothetical protein
MCLGLMFIMLFATTWTVSAQISGQQAPCAARYCSYLPLVLTESLVRITTTHVGRDKLDTVTETTGVIELTTATPVYDLTLEAPAVDWREGRLYTAIITPVFAATLPTQYNRFTYLDYVGAITGPISAHRWNLTSPRIYEPVNVVALFPTSFLYQPSLAIITGTVRNDYPWTLYDVTVLAELDGMGSDYGTDIIASLAPGATANFRVQLGWPWSRDPPLEPVAHAQGWHVPVQR